MIKNDFKKIFQVLCMSFLVSACSLFGKGNEEQPIYKVVTKEGDIEIRRYESYIVAKTKIEGDFKDAQTVILQVLMKVL